MTTATTVNVTKDLNQTHTLIGSVADFEVGRSRVRFDDGGLRCQRMGDFPQRDVIYRIDSGEPLSVVSSDYSMVSNRQVFETIETALREAGHDFRCNVGLLANGARFKAIYVLPDISLEVARGDRLSAAILAGGSYDGSNVQFMTLGAYRWTCLNLQVGSQEMFGGGLRSQHKGDLEADVIAAAPMLEQMVKEFPERAKLFTEWTQQPWSELRKHRTNQIFEEAPGFARHGKTLADRWKSSATTWDAYNIGTAYSTRECRSIPVSYRVGAQVNEAFASVATQCRWT